jgi:hypothetical protein
MGNKQSVIREEALNDVSKLKMFLIYLSMLYTSHDDKDPIIAATGIDEDAIPPAYKKYYDHVVAKSTFNEEAAESLIRMVIGDLYWRAVIYYGSDTTTTSKDIGLGVGSSNVEIKHSNKKDVLIGARVAHIVVANFCRALLDDDDVEKIFTTFTRIDNIQDNAI